MNSLDTLKLFSFWVDIFYIKNFFVQNTRHNTLKKKNDVIMSHRVLVFCVGKCMSEDSQVSKNGMAAIFELGTLPLNLFFVTPERDS